MMKHSIRTGSDSLLDQCYRKQIDWVAGGCLLWGVESPGRIAAAQRIVALIGQAVWSDRPIDVGRFWIEQLC